MSGIYIVWLSGMDNFWQSLVDEIVCFFFFQAEDGIRDLTVTGVQTCALPIYVRRGVGVEHHQVRHLARGHLAERVGAQQLGALPRRGRERLDRRQAGGDEQAQLFVQREARYEQLVRGVGAGRDEPARALELADELVLTSPRSPERLEFAAAPPRAAQP